MDAQALAESIPIRLALEHLASDGDQFFPLFEQALMNEGCNSRKMAKAIVDALRIRVEDALNKPI